MPEKIYILYYSFKSLDYVKNEIDEGTDSNSKYKYAEHNFICCSVFENNIFSRMKLIYSLKKKRSFGFLAHHLARFSLLSRSLF